MGNIVKLTPTDLLLLIAEFEDKEDLVKCVKDSIAQNSKLLPKTVLENSVDLLKATFKDLTTHVAPNVVKCLLDGIEKQTI